MNKKRKRERMKPDQLLLVFAGMMFGFVPLLIGIVVWKIRKQRAALFVQNPHAR